LHAYSVKENPERFVCGACDVIFTDLDELIDHIIQQHDADRYGYLESSGLLELAMSQNLTVQEQLVLMWSRSLEESYMHDCFIVPLVTEGSSQCLSFR
jgi:hypothetical protein